MLSAEALAAILELRPSQIERLQLGGLRHRRDRRGKDDDDDDDDNKKKKTYRKNRKDDDSSKKDDDDEDDDESSSSTQTRTFTSQQQSSRTSLVQTTTSASIQQTTQQTVTSQASQSSSSASTTMNAVSQSASFTNTFSTSAVAVTSIASTSPSLTAIPELTSSQAISTFTTSRRTSSTTSKNAAETYGISSTHDPNVTKPASNSDIILFALVGAAAGIAILLTIAYHLYNRLHKPKGSHAVQEANAYNLRSSWDGRQSYVPESQSRHVSMAFAPGSQNLAGAGGGNGNRGFGGLVDSAADREERLARVRTDILGSRELQLGKGLSPELAAASGGKEKGNAMHRVRSVRFAGAVEIGGDEKENEKEKETEEKKLDDDEESVMVVMRNPFHEGVDENAYREETAANPFDDEDARSEYSVEIPRPLVARERESTAESEASLPRWRDPVTWARDQARRNETRGPVDRDSYR